MDKVNLICLDSEGGHGGSSKSLLIALKEINQKYFNISVICKKKSWVENEYNKNKINCEIATDMPTFTSLDKLSRNLYSFLYFSLIIWPLAFRFRRKIKKYLVSANIVHFNHVNQFLIAFWIKKKFPKIKITMHIRTMPYANFFSHLQLKISQQLVDKFICITENEYEHFMSILKHTNIEKNIIFNSIEEIKINKKKYSFLKKHKSLLVGSYSNFSFYRGTDRVILLASKIPKEKLKKILFVIVGETKITKGDRVRSKNLSGCSNLEEYADKLGVKDSFVFLGHISNVEEVLINTNITLKLSRENNPWGRDIIESMFYKIPVISIGKYEGFIKNEFSGFLLKSFDLEKLVEIILEILANKNKINTMGYNARKIVCKKCDVKKNAFLLEKLWKKML
ncbi:MAG: hypothetical protein CMJ08_05625 [Pelagibacterales bacterium]|nr:hypothetical protein [Pelagibacterales bacterium]